MVKQWSKLTGTEKAILSGFGGEQGIFVRPSTVRALSGDGNAALLLHQLIFWSQSDMAEERDGWFFLTTQRLQKETGLSYEVQLRVRQKLVNLGVLEQERRGVPAKNYYRVNLGRIAELLIESENKKLASTSSRTRDSRDLDKGKAQNYIVNPLVKDKVNNNSVAPKSAKINVLGDKVEEFVAWAVKTYPVNAHGIGATEGQARKAIEKIGGYAPNASPETIARHNDAVKKFITGIKNLRAATQQPSFDPKFVPGFANFSGLGIQYGKEPAYIAWAARKAPEDQKPKLIV